MNKMTNGKLVLLGEDNSGRDEMNLAGNPFALLQAASRNGQSFIKNEWERTLPNGKIVIAKWEVNGHAELGLPGPNEELLYLVLLQITREAADEKGVWPQKVYFTRGRILEMMKWSDSAPSYKTLRECLIRLSNVQVNADNAFWDAKAKMPYETISFGLINEFALASEPRGRKGQGITGRSWFEWNKTVYESFLAGNVRSLALDFVLSLDLPTTRRLFRFLDMMRGATVPAKREFTIGIFKLCERLGMTPYKYASKIKEKLEPAFSELEKRCYLESVRYEKGKNSENVVFRFLNVSPVIMVEETMKTSRMASKRQEQAILEETEEKNDNIRADAMKCYEIFQSLPTEEQSKLMTLAKAEINPIWHDRIGLPDSPMSLGLWQLVAQKYSGKLKL
jgi:hypothetical protein